MDTSPTSFEYQLAHIHESRQWQIITLNAVMSFLATVAVALRLVSRRLIKNPLKADDYMILFSLITSYGLAIVDILGSPSHFVLCLCFWRLSFWLSTDLEEAVHFGLGKHLLADGTSAIQSYLKTLYAYVIVYTVCLPTIKISILLFYHRVFPIGRFTILLYAAGTFITLWFLSALLVAIFQCTPIHSFWDKLVEGKCINSYVYVLTEGALTILTDIMILTMPMPLVWRLKISWRRKAAVSGIFLLGGFVCVTSIIRMPTLHDIFTIDSTWTTYAPSQWSVVEANLGIVCACLPIMRPLFLGLKPRTGRSAESSRTETQNSKGKESKKSPWSTAGTTTLADEEMIDSWQNLNNPSADPWTRKKPSLVPREAGRVGGPLDVRRGHSEVATGGDDTVDLEQGRSLAVHEGVVNGGLRGVIPEPPEAVAEHW